MKSCGECKWWKADVSDTGIPQQGSCPVWQDIMQSPDGMIEEDCGACPAFDDGSYGKAVGELLEAVKILNNPLSLEIRACPKEIDGPDRVHVLGYQTPVLTEAIAAVESARGKE